MSDVAHNKSVILIRRIARIWGSLIVAFVLFFLIAHLFGNEGSGEGLNDTKELIAFIFFPVSTLVGLSIAYKWEGLGGLIASLGLIIGPIVTGQYPNKAEDLIFVMIIYPPGFLYVIYWFRSKKEKPALQ